jgi:hypothetical protein
VKGRLPALFMALLLLLYLVFVVQYAVRLLMIDEVIARIMGVALIVLPLIGGWALAVELIFGVRAERLAARLEAEGGVPDDELPSSPSGRIDRSAADERFPIYQAAVEADPDSWQNWYRLGLAYDASGDRRRARWAIRQAIHRSS